MEIKVVRQILEWNEDCHKEVQEELNENNVKMINIQNHADPQLTDRYGKIFMDLYGEKAS